MNSLSAWPSPPDQVVLPAGEVHVWRVTLEMDPAALDKLQQALAPEEKSRAGQFHFPRDRAHFVAARGALRDILARYLDRDPAGLQFSYGPSGKPTLAPGPEARWLHFNLSHSHGLALYGLTRSGEIGIDLERIAAEVARERVAERFFSPQEVAELRALPAHLQPRGFFNCWTRKEAYVKARGDGLRIPLDSFDVSLIPGAPPAFLRGVESHWSLRELLPAPGYAAAVVTEGHAQPLRSWQWPGGRAAVSGL
jgi:4'-phosphopantetheinyl transferase